MKKLFILLSLQFAVCNLQFATAGTVKQVYNGGNSNVNSVVIVINAEGYTSTQEAKFDSDVLVKVNYFFTNPIAKANSFKFNIYSDFCASVNSGITQPSAACFIAYNTPVLNVTTYFGCEYDFEGVCRAIQPKSNAQVFQQLYDIPGYSGQTNYLPCLQCNTTQAGGFCSGNVSIWTCDPQWSNETMLHELLGHAIGGVNDEYPTATLVESWNTTKIQPVRWQSVFNGFTHLVPLDTANGWLKPTVTCKMNVLGTPFCLVCAAQINTGINEYIVWGGGAVPTTGNPPPLNNQQPTGCEAPLVTIYCPANYKNLFYAGIDNYTTSDKQYNVKIALHNAGVFITLNPITAPAILGTYNGNTISVVKILPNTVYDVMVQKQCVDGSVSAWKTITLTTGTGLFYHAN